MARAVLLALACAGTLAAGARYGDYSGAIMPQYGGDYDARAAPPADDYRDHSPDASAHLDYKYEEVSSGKMDKSITTDTEEDNSWNKPVKKPRHEKSVDDEALNKYKLDKIDKPTSTDAEEDNSWNKPVKKLRNEESIDDIEPGALNKYNLDEGPKFQSKYRGNIVARHRNKNTFRTEEAWSRRVRPSRDDQQILRADEEENQLRLQGVRDDDSLENEQEKSNFARREIKPKVRRKARDRPNLNTLMKVENDDEENLSDMRDVQKTLRGGQEYREEEEPAVSISRLGGRAGASAGEDDDDFVAPPPPGSKQKPAKNLNEYADYYDMQRLQNMKKKLSARLPNAWRKAPPAPRRIIATRRMHVQPARIRDPVVGARLALATRITGDPFDGAPLEPTTGITSSYPHDGDPLEPATGITSSYPHAGARLEPATETISDPLIGAQLTPTRTHHTTTESPVVSVPHELSIAEKSRLSILKKAQRKESSRFNGTSTYKPPVLLQVTKKLQTLVMVERPLNQELWKRAREVSDDTPERLKKVKSFMRRKLVANANDIRNLTDNWNDVVCDYVDMAMLDAKASSLKTYIPLLLNLPVVYLIYL